MWIFFFSTGRLPVLFWPFDWLSGRCHSPLLALPDSAIWQTHTKTASNPQSAHCSPINQSLTHPTIAPFLHPSSSTSSSSLCLSGNWFAGLNGVWFFGAKSWGWMAQGSPGPGTFQRGWKAPLFWTPLSPETADIFSTPAPHNLSFHHAPSFFSQPGRKRERERQKKRGVGVKALRVSEVWEEEGKFGKRAKPSKVIDWERDRGREKEWEKQQQQHQTNYAWQIHSGQTCLLQNWSNNEICRLGAAMFLTLPLQLISISITYRSEAVGWHINASW